MYLYKQLPEHFLAYKYGNRLTQKKKQQCAEHLLEFVSAEYPKMADEHKTIDRALSTIEQFIQTKKFTFNDGSYSADNSGGYTNKPLIMVEL
jgi:hypothetical protein